MIAIGIGMHNLGEGLAIGTVIGLGQIAFNPFSDCWICSS